MRMIFNEVAFNTTHFLAVDQRLVAKVRLFMNLLHFKYNLSLLFTDGFMKRCNALLFQQNL